MAAPDPPPQPDFITFLFSQKPKFDCHFIVGEKSLVKPERFGAVKMMLMAHSVVFRTELEDSELKEKGDIAVKDMYPDTFRTLLKFIYGYDTIGDLEFDEADNLFYAAEKYMMSNLKNSLALRLIALLTPDNLCSLLNNPACATQLLLNAHITQILRYETDKVLASPQFLEVSPEGFISILKQDGLAVPEIELWRAAMKWAKHRVQMKKTNLAKEIIEKDVTKSNENNKDSSEKGGEVLPEITEPESTVKELTVATSEIADSEDWEEIRRQLSRVSKHLRICTLSCEQFCQEVGSVGVLNGNELQLVVQSIGKKKKINDLTEFCNDIEPRVRLNKKVKVYRKQRSTLCADQESHILRLNNSEKEVGSQEFTFTILTKQYTVELLPVVCLAQKRHRMDPKGWTYKFGCELKISKEIKRNVQDSPLTVTHSGEAEYGKTFEIPLAVDGYNVILPPNSKYVFEMSSKEYIDSVEKLEEYEECVPVKHMPQYVEFVQPISCGGTTSTSKNPSPIFENDHILLEVKSSCFPSNCLHYRLVDDG